MRAKFIWPTRVSAPTGDEAKPRFFYNRFPSSSRCLFLLLTIVLLVSAPLATWAKETLAIELSAEEQAWLAEHPEIVLGAPTDYPPMVIMRADGTHIGVLVDLFEQISRRLNTNIRLHIEDSWGDVQKKAQNREIDGLAFGGRDPSRDALYNATDIVLPTYFSVFARTQHDYQLKTFSDLDGLRIGYKRAARPTRSLLEKLPSAILKPYDDHESMTQALLSKEIDVIVAWMSYDFWRKEKMQGTIDNIFLIEEYPMEMVTYIRKDWPELIPILNKAITALQQDELPRIINKWFGQWPKKSPAAKVHLTTKERAWLAQNNTIRVSFWLHPPFFYIEDGKVVGIAVDFLDKITEFTGITFQFEDRLERFSDVLQRLKEHKGPDLVAALMPTIEREKAILFTEPYFNSPRFIFTRDDASFVSVIENLFGKKVAVVEDSVIHDTLVEEYPNIDFLIYNDNEEALRAVSAGKVFAFFGDLVATPAMINEFGLKNLKAVCPSGLPDHPFAMATRNDWPELRDILDRALKAIPADEKAAIMNKWFTVRIEYGISSGDIIKWILFAAGAASVVFLFFIAWNKQLSRKVDERTSQLSESESRFRATFEQAAVGVAHVSLEGSFLRVNRKFCEIAGYSEDEILAMTFQDITHPDDLNTDLEFVQQVLKGARENYSMDKRYYRKDGSLVWINLTVSLLFDKEGSPKYFVSVIRDISKHKKIQEDLASSEAKYRELVDNSIVGVFNTNIKGEFLFVNEAMVEMYDFDSPEQMLAEGSLSRWADPELHDKLLALLNEQGSVTNFEAETVTNTGRHIQVILSVKQLGENIFGMLMDISDRKLAENKLHEAFTEIEHLQKQLQAESAYLQEEIKLEHNFENIIGQSETLKYVLHRVEQVAPLNSTVLILGETGTGKELIARALHQLSSRSKRPLVKVNCAALPGELVESELFGREKGAFTGATSTQIGRFEFAHKSTLFLDEIGEMPIMLQAKLLRVLESGEFERLGSSRTLKSDVRIIAATNRDLEKEVLDNRFREDLLYRLKIFPITLPPLRDRVDDIPLLVQEFIQFFSRKMGKPNAINISQNSLHSLQSYSWPGNVRELMHVVESAFISVHGDKLHFDIPQTADVARGDLKSFEEMEREYILRVLVAKNWKVEGEDSAASILGMPPSTLRSRIKKLGLKRP